MAKGGRGHTLERRIQPGGNERQTLRNDEAHQGITTKYRAGYFSYLNYHKIIRQNRSCSISTLTYSGIPNTIGLSIILRNHCSFRMHKQHNNEYRTWVQLSDIYNITTKNIKIFQIGIFKEFPSSDDLLLNHIVAVPISMAVSQRSTTAVHNWFISLPGYTCHFRSIRQTKEPRCSLCDQSAPATGPARITLIGRDVSNT